MPSGLRAQLDFIDNLLGPFPIKINLAHTPAYSRRAPIQKTFYVFLLPDNRG